MSSQDTLDDEVQKLAELLKLGYILEEEYTARLANLNKGVLELVLLLFISVHTQRRL